MTHYSKAKMTLSALLAGSIQQHGLDAAGQDQLYRMIMFYVDQIKAYQRQDVNNESIIYSLYEAMEEEYSQLPDEWKRKIQCGKGCAHCCHINVDVTAPEASLIQAWCEDHDITIDYEYLSAGHRRCFFLDENNACKIYEVRPLPCRKYFTISPPERCDSTRYPKGSVMNYINFPMEVIASAVYNVFTEQAHLATMLVTLKPKIENEHTTQEHQ